MNTTAGHSWLQQHCPTLLAGARRLPAALLAGIKRLGRFLRELCARAIMQVCLMMLAAFMGFCLGYYVMWKDLSQSCDRYRTHSVPWADLPYNCWYDTNGTMIDHLEEVYMEDYKI